MQDPATKAMLRASEMVQAASNAESDPRCRALLERAALIVEIAIDIKREGKMPRPHPPAVAPANMSSGFA